MALRLRFYESCQSTGLADGDSHVGRDLATYPCTASNGDMPVLMKPAVIGKLCKQQWIHPIGVLSMVVQLFIGRYVLLSKKILSGAQNGSRRKRLFR